MESFYLITPIALLLIAIAIGLFLWAVNNGQFDDLDREASRILFDDDTDPASNRHPPQSLNQTSNPTPEDDTPASVQHDARTTQ